MTGTIQSDVGGFLAEAGAVHPEVHAPARVQQWLADHNWRHEPSPDPKRLAVEWASAEAQRYMYVPQHTDAVDYVERVDELLCVAANAADMTLSQALAEVAALPDEVAW